MKPAKRFCLFLIPALLACLLIVPAAAREVLSSGSCGEDISYTLYNDGKLVISGTGAMTNYSSYSSVPWYSKRSKITTVTVKNGVTSIGEHAFYYCTNLSSVTIPDSVTSIGDNAFDGCNTLTSITIPDSVTSIGYSAFFSCKNLMSITIPDSVSSIGYSAFYNTAWYNNQPDGLVYAGRVVYKYKGTMPANTQIVLKDGTKGFADGAFNGFTSLTGVTIPNSVTSIGKEAFGSCKSLTSITIPDSVTSIGWYAFQNCSSLTSVTIPDSVTSIGGYAFSNCTGLSDIYYCGLETEWNAISIGINNDPLINAAKHYQKIAAGTCGANSDDVLWVLYENGELVISGTGSMTNYSSYTSVPWYSNHSMIKTATIENGVTIIGTSAFSNCTNLTSIAIPDSVTSIGGYAFNNCTNLTSVTIPDNVTSIGESAFYSCRRLTSVTIPDGVTSIDGGAFFGCTLLSNVYYYGSEDDWNAILIGSNNTPLINAARYFAKEGRTLLASGFCGTNVTYKLYDDELVISGTGEMADYKGTTSQAPWYSNRSCITTVIVENGVTGVGEYAFYSCTSLASMTIPDSVTSIGNYAFYGCTSLANVTIPDSVTSIGKRAFDNTAWYNSQPDGLVYAGKVAYQYKGTMQENTQIVLKDGTKEIGNNAFYNCTGLKSIMIPDSVTSIGDSAFYNCIGLKDVYYDGSADDWNTVTIGVSNSPLSNAKKHYAYGSCGANVQWNLDRSTGTLVISGTGAMTNYSSYTSVPWYNDCLQIKSVTIENGVTSISGWAFCNCIGLTSITIPNSVTSIGSSAFSGCTRLTSVHTTDIVAWCAISFFNPDSNPLYYAKNLYLNDILVTDLVIPESVTSIGGGAFYNCTSLTNITISDSVTSIGDSAFNGCIGLTSITIPDGVTNISKCAFCNCTGLTSITIPDSVTSIEYKAFYNCTGLTNITIPDSVTSIGDWAFFGCTSLTNITIPDGVTSIGWSGFSGCTSLASVTIPDSVTSIDDWAFFGCTSLTNITIPDGVTSIGDSAFSGCSALGKAEISEGVLTIGNNLFANCFALTTVTLPESINSISQNAFDGDVRLADVYFYGTPLQWENLTGSYVNTPLYNAYVHFVYKIQYDPNGGTEAPEAQTDVQGVSFTISRVFPKRAKHTFLGWSTIPNASAAQYAAGQTFVPDRNMKLYAVWEEIEQNSPFSLSAPALYDADDNETDSIPHNIFYVDVELKNVDYTGAVTVVFACYDASGRFVTTKTVPANLRKGRTGSYGADFDNTDGRITQVKVFVLSDGLAPLASPVAVA